ncbi:MAG: hypothetical protein K9L22_04655 [Methylococcaceae bacterium]|nr:hypothetical protein [Methylococcaceae bacterium]
MMVRYLKRLAIRLLVITLSGLASSHAQDIAIIMGARSDIKQLSAEQVRRIFLSKERLTAQGDRWIPVNLSAHNVVRQVVTEQVLQLTPFELERFWYEQYFNGVSPPYVLASEQAVLRFVSETPNAIGYILSCHADVNVKAVYTFNDNKLDSKLCP